MQVRRLSVVGVSVLVFVSWRTVLPDDPPAGSEAIPLTVPVAVPLHVVLVAGTIYRMWNSVDTELVVTGGAC